MEDIEEYLVDSENLIDSNNDLLLLEEESEKVTLTKYDEFISSVSKSYHHDEQSSLVSQKPEDKMKDVKEYLFESESIISSNIDLCQEESEKSALTKYDEFISSVSKSHHNEQSLIESQISEDENSNSLLIMEDDDNITKSHEHSNAFQNTKYDEQNMGNIDEDIVDLRKEKYLSTVNSFSKNHSNVSNNTVVKEESNSAVHIKESNINYTASNLFDPYLNQQNKVPNTAIVNSTSIHSNTDDANNISKSANKIAASDLFNEYLNVALNSPVVMMMNSRPTSPVVITDSVKITANTENVSDLAKRLYNDYVDVAVHSPVVLSHSMPSSPSYVESNLTLVSSFNIIEPLIEWSHPQNTIEGSILSELQLNAKCKDVDGEFSYDPPVGSVLSAGKNSLTVTFIPIDLSKYLIVSKSVNIIADKSNINSESFEQSVERESYLPDIAENSVADSCESQIYKKQKKKKTKKVKTIRTASPTLRNNSNRVLLPAVEVNNRNSSATNKNKRPVSSHKDTNGLVMEGLMPQYSELVHGIFKRPVVVSILMPPIKATDMVYDSRINSPTNDRVGRVIASVQEHRDQEMLKSKTESSIILKEKVRRLPNFVVKVFDLVDSKEGLYTIVMRDFVNLRNELIKEMSSEIKQYYKPNSISWWFSHLKLFLVIYVKPNSEFSVIVDKKAIKNFVKKKMQHHSWMKSTQLSYSSNEESPMRKRNLLSASASSLNISWKKLEDLYYSISLSEKEGNYWRDMKILFSSDVGPFNSEASEFESDFDNFELSESWLKMEKAFRDIPETQKKGLSWKKLNDIFLSARSQKKNIVGYPSDLDSLDLSEASQRKKEKVMKHKPIIKKKEDIVEDHLPSISDSQNNNRKKSLLKSRKSISPVNNRMKSSSSSTANPLKSNRALTSASESIVLRAKTAPISEVRESVKLAIDKSILNKPITATILDEDYPEISQAQELTFDEKADIYEDFDNEFPLLSEKSEIAKTSPTRKEKEKKERKQSPEKKGIAVVNPFEHPIPTKKYAGPKKIAIDIIKKAREEVSKNKTFINRKITHSEVRLLDSPFAKKVYIPPTDVENLMSDLSVSSWNSSVN